MHSIRFLYAYTALLVFGCVPPTISAQRVDGLQRGFEQPPNSARPRVWWHWMNGNVTREGIRLDLEWMHRVGLGGFQNFDVSLGTPQLVEHRLTYMSQEWKDTFRYATNLADRLGLEESIAASPGWSETGGPWVQAAEAMKKYVWSETLVSGGVLFQGRLEHPPIVTGPFQDLERFDPLAADHVSPGVWRSSRQYYADSKVIAFQLNSNESSDLDAVIHASSSDGPLDALSLRDGRMNTSVKILRGSSDNPAWILYDYHEPRTIRSVTFALLERPDPAAGLTTKTLEASDDGQTFRLVAHLPDNRSVQRTVSFAPVRARYFRVVLRQIKTGGASSSLKPAPTYEIAEFNLHSDLRIHRFEDKAAFVPSGSLYDSPTPQAELSDAIPVRQVLDLSETMQPDGRLEWTPPPGRWMVLRFGYSLLGIANHPSSPEAAGLEVDKLSRPSTKRYMDHYLDSYRAVVGPQMMGKRGVRFVVTDSWEAGAQNWTDDILEQFKRRRGYDPIPWMPALSGRVVQSSSASDRFLWDFRKTIADLTAEEHYGQLEDSLRARGMGHYGESHESGRAFIGDGMEVKKYDEVPMGAMWLERTKADNELFVHNADDRESASVAHIYGQNLAAAESLSTAISPWSWSPATLKSTADKELAEGINRFVIHCSVHQPFTDKKPGIALGPYGQWFTRNDTWAEKARPWIDYLARSSFLLQQGHFAADVLYFYGEDDNITQLFAHVSPPVPIGYAYDFVNADALVHEFEVSRGSIQTRTGMSYRLLALDPNSRHMSLPVLKRIRELVLDGAAVVGARPTDTPSLADDAGEFEHIVTELWGDGADVRHVGKGRVYTGVDIAHALNLEGVIPDFEYSDPKSDKKVVFVHRRLDDGDIYFVDNRTERETRIQASFRVTGRKAELWHAETGTSEPASFQIAGDRTTVPLRFEPFGTVFVVFRGKTNAQHRQIPIRSEKPIQTIEGPWQLAFEAGRGAPPQIMLDTLASWSDHANSGVRYFSGTATYTKGFYLSSEGLSRGGRIVLDLGDVKNMAEVFLNDRPLGLLWHPPFRVDITDAVHFGTNHLRIEVTNAWVNRLIGDQQPGIEEPYTYTVYQTASFAPITPPYRADSPLLPSGLLGPVRLFRAR